MKNHKKWYLIDKEGYLILSTTKKPLKDGFERAWQIDIPFAVWDTYAKSKLVDELHDAIAAGKTEGLLDFSIGQTFYWIWYRPVKTGRKAPH